ncbi:unnamed protein product [Brassica napus]|uniref:(rape) hypothetical protein n=1 Tax=Brassica napus TaxID=3708 RepID=A0A816YBL1_BRANA|nr:unnamed protein product [Brassica napus]
MGRLFRLVMGLWSKSSNGDWSFQETGSGHDESLIINRNDSFEGVLERIRIMVDLGILTPVALTYQLPDWMLEPEGAKSPPITLLCDKDVEIMSTVSDYMYDPVLYVTSGPEQVAKYQFYCRSPFKIDETTYLKDGVTEEEHREAIRDLVGGHPIVCSHHILELMYNEPQLLLVYRVALEIEMVYGVPNDHEETEDPAEFLNLTGEENMATDEGVSIHPLHPANDDPNIQDRVNDSVNVTNPATQDDVEPVSTLMIGDSSAAVGKEKTTSADELKQESVGLIPSFKPKAWFEMKVT